MLEQYHILLRCVNALLKSFLPILNKNIEDKNDYV